VMIRFFFSLSGVDTGNTFGAIGARRELLVAVLNEPIMLLGLVVMALLAGSTNLGIISTKVISGSIPISTAVWLGGLAFAFSYFVEMGKLPFDLGEAEQELQEGPSAEFSGHSLAILKWALYMKQVVLTALFMAVFLPFGMMTEVTFLGVVISVVTFLLKMFVFYFLVGIVENTEARLRFLKASAVTWIALGAAVLSFVFYLANV
jgi:hydrogenase-4 component C